MRSHVRVSVVVLAVLAFLAVSAVPASAAYIEAGSFAGGGSGPGGSGTEDGQLSSPNQAAVNDASGNLYVADTGNNRVQVFKPTAAGGEYDSQVAITEPTGIAIDQSDGSVYVANASGIAKYDSTLTPVASGWTDPGVSGRLAVDPSTGDLLVADTAANLIRRFESDGTPAGSFAAERPIDLAVDSSGGLLVITSTGDVVTDCSATSAVKRFSGAGVEGGQVGASLTAPGAVAVDPDDDSVVVASRVNQWNCGSEAPLVSFFAADGSALEEIALASDTIYAMVPGLAVQGDGATRVYAVTRSPYNDTFGATKVTAFEEPQPHAPEILGQWVQRGSDSATLRARLNPGGLETEYHFEYGPTAAYGSQTESKATPATFDNQTVTATIAGLKPGTTYHFHLVAENSIGDLPGPDLAFTTHPGAVAETCPNERFRTGLSALLTDCRAYELVTPPGSHANLRLAGGPATPDGGAVCFDTDYQLLDADPNGIKNVDDGFCSWRRDDGWETKWVTGPAPAERFGTQGANVYYLSDDGSRAVFSSDVAMLGRDFRYPGTVGPTAPPNSAYLWEAGQTTWLAPPSPPVGDPPAIPMEGINRSGGEPGWQAGRRPLAVSDDARHVIFESDLPILPADENTLVDVYEWSPDGLRVVSSDAAGKAAGGNVLRQIGFQTRAFTGTISADGSRVFFSHKGAPLDGSAPEDVESIYMREGDDVTLVSPRRGSGPDADIAFVGASADGERVLLETTQQLTPDPKQDGAAIYSYDVSGDELTLEADADGGVQILGASADASTFVYRKQLDNALIVRRGGTAVTLGTHSASDLADYRVASGRYDVRALRFTPDGSALAFVSAGEIGPFGPGVAQVYRWAAGEGVENIAAPADGAATENASIGSYAAVMPGDPREEVLHFHKNKMLSGRVISDDGSRVFFESPEALVNRDVNGATDVYEWHDGRVNLVSSGTGARSLYHESSADGRTVFFQSFERLIPELDINQSRDLYVARAGGGFPLPAVKPRCEGEGCQTALQAPVASDPGRPTDDGNLPAAPRVAIGKKQLKQLANKGKTTLKVTVGAPGRITALLKAKLKGGEAAVVARASKNATKPGTLGLELRLSKKARAKLAKSGKLALTLEIRQAGQTVRKGVMLHG